jgi:hypothetical protein
MSKMDNRNMSRQGRVGSELSSSEAIMGLQQKKMIKQILDYDIMDVRTYKGYKGDLLLEVTTLSPEVSTYVKDDAEKLGFEVVTIKDAISVYKVYCILYVNDSYSLKVI